MVHAPLRWCVQSPLLFADAPRFAHRPQRYATLSPYYVDGQREPLPISEARVIEL